MKTNPLWLSALKQAFYALTGGFLLLTSQPCSASVVIDTVYVGNAGNAANPITSYGAVNYDYAIGTYEVTNGQYAAFLNSVASSSDPYGLYQASMEARGISRTGSAGNYSYSVTSGYENRAVSYISWYSAARFVNWMQNGQIAGGTETGAYTLNGAMGGTFSRNADAIFALPTADEWYKAAYYDPTLNDGMGGYWLYATQSNTPPAAMAPNSTNPNSGNLNGWRSPNGPTDVGAYTLAKSFYGTFDQSGNVLEYAELFKNGGSLTAVWGGNYNFGGMYTSSSDMSNNPLWIYPDHINDSAGFRIVYLAVPEPGTFLLLGLAAGGMVLFHRKRQSCTPSWR